MEKKGFFSKLVGGLAKTRNNLTEKVNQLISYYREIDDEFYEELEEILVYADVGVATTGEIIERLRARVDQEKIGDTAKIREYLSEILMDMVGTEGELELPSPSIILVVGVNGVGKTTAIGKMAHYYKSEGKKVMLGAADTFRAAASEQLTI